MDWKKFLLGVAFFLLAQSLFAEEIRNVELLAASCASCHGTRGHSVGGTPNLAGLDKLYFMQRMTQFVTTGHISTVMHHHASGYSAEEIALLATFFSKQTKP